MYSIGKSIDTESRLVVTSGWWVEGHIFTNVSGRIGEVTAKWCWDFRGAIKIF